MMIFKWLVMRVFLLKSRHWLLFLLLALPSVLFFGLMLTISVAFILEEVVFYMKWVNVVMDLRIFSLLLFTTWAGRSICVLFGGSFLIVCLHRSKRSFIVDIGDSRFLSFSLFR